MLRRSDAVIFLGGAPGSGKSTIAASLRETVPGLVVATAGQLIRQGLGREGAYQRPPVSGASEAGFFQDVLVSEFTSLRMAQPGPALLDGHFAVPTNEGPVAIAGRVFERLGCTHLVLVELALADLAERLRARGGAAWWDGSIDALRLLVDADRAAAQAAAAALGTPVLRVGGDDEAVTGIRAALGGE